MKEASSETQFSSPLKRALFALKDMRARLETLEQAKTEPIAVVGLGCRFPGADSPARFWELLRNGEDAIGELSLERRALHGYTDSTNNSVPRFGGWVPHPDLFDADFFGIAPREAISMDPQQRLLLEVTWEALEDAGQSPDGLIASQTGVFVGACTNDYMEIVEEAGLLDTYKATGNAASVLAGRLSYVLGLQGPSMVVDTACSSSLVAVHLACQSLRNGECRMALAGGVNRILTPGVTAAFARAKMLSPDGRCKTFDAAADGFVRGEGCGMIVLKRLSDALDSRDRILAVIRGSAVNQDGRSSGLTAPNGPSQESVIRKALEAAGVAPAEIQYVEAHGTGTALGDPIEVQALNAVLSEGRSSDRPVIIGSVKANVGHLEAAAGIAGLIKTVLAIERDEIPPHLHFRNPNLFIAWNDLAVEVATARKKWRAGRRLAAVSAFGFSGTNAQVVLEEAPQARAAMGSTAGGPEPTELTLCLSAKTAAALRELARRYSDHLATTSQSFADICYTAHTGRAHFDHRLAIIASSPNEARTKLEEYLKGAPDAIAEIDWTAIRHDGIRAKVPLPSYPFERESYWARKTEVTPKAIWNRVTPNVKRIAVETGIEQYRDLLPELNDLSRAHVMQALEELGWHWESNHNGRNPGAFEQLPVADKHRRIVREMLERLSGEGILNRGVPSLDNCEARWQKLFRQYPRSTAELELLQRCGRNLVAIFRGDMEPLEALFPGGSLELAEKFYSDSVAARFCNTIMGEVVAAADNSSMLEIGAGTGATTSHLLPLLGGSRRREYVFTDVSAAFIAHAQRKFKDYPFFQYRTLDIQRDPAVQGFAGRQFRMVVASNVLHATNHLRIALRHVRQLLAPKGLLVLLETIVEPDWMYSISAGLLDGWWNFSDFDLRRGHPLLTQQRWLELLAECGFSDAVAIPGDEISSLSRQAVIVAAAPAVAVAQNTLVKEENIVPSQWIDATNQESTALTKYVQNEVARVLGFDPARVNPKRGFFEIGMDSLTALELRDSLQSALARPIPASIIFEHSTVEALAGYLENQALSVNAHSTAQSSAAQPGEPIAIIGMDCRFPGGANSPERFWELLRNGTDAIIDIPLERWNASDYYDPAPGKTGRIVTRRAGFLEGIDRFDAAFFEISPREAVSMDPQQRILLEIAWSALERAGQAPHKLARSRTGVFLGATNNDYARIFGQAENLDAHFMSGNAISGLSGRLSYTLGLQGPSIVIDTACSSSLVAIHLACRSLREGECRLALAGGVNLMLSPIPMMALSSVRMLSLDGRCKTFDAEADGFARGEGCAVVVLKRLSDALADGDPVQAILRGSAVNQDGHSSGFTVPNGAAQEALIREALADAGIAPANVDYIEAHGTGTPLGDPIEVQALGSVLSAGRSAEQPLAIGSVKTNVGHLEAAAGVAGLLKVVLAFQHGEIPPHLNFKTINPEITLDAIPAVIPVKLTPWPSRSGPRIAGVSSFGASGTNAHIVLEEAPPIHRISTEDHRRYVLPLSAKSEGALNDLAALYEEHLARASESFADICYTASTARTHFSHRLAIVAASAAEARKLLAEFLIHGRAAGQLSGIAEQYMAGAEIDWDQLEWGNQRHKVRLPTYPFQRQRYWIERRDEDSEPWKQWLYEIDWQIAPRATPVAAYIAEPETIAARVAEQVPRYDAQYELQKPRELTPQLEALCVDYILDAWRRLGWEPSIGEKLSPSSLAARFDIRPQHVRLLHRMLTILAEESIVERSGAEWQLRRMPEPVDIGAKIADLSARYPAYRMITGILVRCGRDLPRLLRGELDPLQLLFSGTSSTAFDIYEHAPAIHALNGLMRESLQAALQSLPGGSKLRILEIGAGSGSTTDFLLPLLDSDRTEYFFTDISQAFLLRAEQKFRDFRFLRYQPFDLDRPPEEQGLRAHHFDIVVAANVVHATRNLRDSLRHIQHLLAPQGLLLMLEETEPQRWVDLTFGLTEGWWRYSDTGIRLEYPLITSNQWIALLGEMGFTGASAVPDNPELITALGGCAILLARAPETEIKVETRTDQGTLGSWLILADRGGLGFELEQLLTARGEACVTVPAGRAPDDWQTALKLPLRGIVHLWALDQLVLEESNDADLVAALDAGCSTIFRLVHGLAASPIPPPQLWLVTRRARSVDGDTLPPEIAQAPVWSFGAVLAQEHPELRCRRVDLDRTTGAEALLEEILAEDREDQIAMRGSMRYAPRLVRSAMKVRRADRLNLNPNGTYLITGGLGGVGLAVSRWMVERGARHLVLLGRRPPSSDLAFETLRDLRRAGAAVRVFQADVSQASEVARVLDECRATMPPLHGVIHSAMVLDDAPVLQLDSDRMNRVMAPKVLGAWNLHQFTRDEPLEFFVLFSAIISLFGNQGQASYAGANAFLDALAHYRRSLGLPGLSINWGAWDEIGAAMTAGAKVDQVVLRRGIAYMRPEYALRAFEQALSGDVPQVAAFSADWHKFMQEFPAGAVPPFLAKFAEFGTAEKKERPSDGPPILEQLWQAPPPARYELLRTHIGEHVARVLRLEAGNPPQLRQPLHELGMDSLMAVELRNALGLSLERSFPATLLFDYPSVEALTDYVAREVLAAASPETPTSDARVTDPLRDIEELSDDEVDRLFAEKVLRTHA